MSEFKFCCPKCGQKMYAADEHAGTQINCPACQNEIIVPQPISAARPRAATVVVVTPKTPPPPPAPVVPVAAVRPAYVPKDSASDGSKTKMIVTLAVVSVVILCPIIFFFAFPDQVTSLENKFGFAGKKVDPESGGGQLGHIADLYSVLDATDPDKMAGDPADAEKYKKEMEDAEKAAEKAEQDAAIAEANIPLGEVSWNLNPSEDIIPTGKPHGLISGTNFVADVVRLEKQANQFLLTLRKGTNVVPECEMQIYLQLKPDEEIEGKSWTVAASQKTGAPRVIKKWVTNPKFAPQQKIYAGGYAMFLDFGQGKMGKIPAAIYVALPDTEKSFVGGNFKVDEFRQKFSFKMDDGDF